MGSSEDWEELLLPEIERQQNNGKEAAFRGIHHCRPDKKRISAKRGHFDHRVGSFVQVSLNKRHASKTMLESETETYREHQVPESYVDGWQGTVNVLARIFDVPAGLIMRVLPSEIEVLVANRTRGNPYERQEKAKLNTGLYCETVMATRSPLHVPNALEDPKWRDNPDVKLNMISYLGMPLMWPDGSVFGTICVLDDKARPYTQLYQDLLQQFRQIIERDFQLIARTGELEDTLHQLEQIQEKLVFSEKMAALGHLVAGITHELNSPVGVMRAAADVSGRCIERIDDLLEAGRSSLEGKLHKLLDVLRENLGLARTAESRVSQIVQSLKEFAALDQAELQRIDIHKDLDNTLVLIDQELRDRATVHKDYGDVPLIECYRSQISQVFMILLVTASEAIPGKGTITIRTRSETGKVFIEISDTGRGLAPDEMKKLFDFSFIRKGSRVAMSVGLSTVRQIIDKHHGNITVESEPGEGTTFQITLPIQGLLTHK